MIVEPKAHRGHLFSKIYRVHPYRDGAHCLSSLPRTLRYDTHKSRLLTAVVGFFPVPSAAEPTALRAD